MPLYEYQCTACGKLTEKRQKFSDPEITDCPHCGGHLERTITAPAVQFKGGGWYADLYSKGVKKPAANTPSEGGSSGEAAKSEGNSSAETAKSDGGGKSDSGSKSDSSASASAGTSSPAASPSTPSSTPSK